MAGLKPCPFCGGRASVKKFVSKNGAFEIYNVYCMNEDCRVEPITHDYFHKEEAIEAWNRRAEDGTENH